MSISLSGSLVITGSIVASGGITGSFSGSATTSSYATTASSVLPLNQTLIVSGSTSITGSLQVTGSISTTGTITAQTLVVQTVTSSVVYSSGSNIFGNQLTNVQQMTGSVTVTGSFKQTGANSTSLFTGLVGVNNTIPTYSLDIVGNIPSGSLRVRNTGIHAQFTVDGTTGLFFRDGTNASWKSWMIGTSQNDGSELSFTPSTNTSGTPTWDTTSMVIQGTGKVGIGTTSPISTLSVGVTSDTASLGSTGLTIGGASTLTSGNVLMLNFTPIGASSGRARAGIGCVVGADWGKGNLTFYTRDASNSSAMTTADERMRIASDGTVTITSSIASEVLLNVKNTSSTGNGLVIAAGSTSSHFVLKVENYNGTLDLFQVKGDGTVKINQLTSNGTVATQSSNGTLYVSSDANLKIEDGYIENGLEKVLALKPRYFYWKDKEAFSADRQLGFYAQEVNAISEETANTPADGCGWGIYDRGLVALLTKAIQELSAKVDAQAARIEELENK